jgi:hypothetical protein
MACQWKRRNALQAPIAIADNKPKTVALPLTSLKGDFIKVQSLVPREAYFAHRAEARKVGLP